MVRSFRRGALAAVLALSLAPLAACAAGNGAQTYHVRPDSQSVTVGVIKVQNAVVLTQNSGSGPATVSARLFNNGTTDQTLQAVQIGSGTPVTLAGADGGQTITVPAGGSVLLGGKNNPTAVIADSGEAFQDGDVQNAVFNFSTTGAVALPVNVIPATGYWEPYGPGAIPTTAAPSPSARVTPSGTATPQGTATPKGTATPTDTTTTKQ